MIDTHAHLFADEFTSDIQSVIKSLTQIGVQKVFLPNIDVESIAALKQVTGFNPDLFFPMMGLHPGSVNQNFEQDLNTIHQELKASKYYAVGEIGIDLYWDKTFIEEQKKCFEIQIKWAKEMNLPIAIHVREAFDEVFEIVDRNHDDNLFGVFHCFTGDANQAKHVMEYKNFMMGIGGVVTYKTSTLPEVLKAVPLDFLVLETDSPYLPPVPFRGKRNEPAYLVYIIKKLSEIYGTTVAEIEKITNANANRLFNT